MKNRVLKVLLPFFPESRYLDKQWWHKLARIITLLWTSCSIYTVLWFASIFLLTIPSSIEHFVYLPAYLPLNFVNLLTIAPLYGIIFRKLIYVPYIGPFLLPLLLIIIFYFLPSLIYRTILFIVGNIHSRKVKIVVILIGLGIIFFVSYLWKFQQVVTEGSLLVDEHCIKINPLIIDRKNKYTDQYNLMMSSASTDQYMDALAKYRVSATVYTNEEKIWLAKQRKFLDSKEFNQWMPSYVKEAAEHQYKMYEAQYLSSFYLLQDFIETDKDKQVELGNKVSEETNISNEEQDKYNAVWEREKGRNDWRFNFVKTPDSKCPTENNDFPTVPNPFAPPVIPNSPLS